MCHLRFAFHERPAATVSAWVQVGGGLVEDARVAVGSVGVRPTIVPGVAASASGQDARDIDPAVLASIGEAGAEAAAPVSDANGGEDYKRALVRTLVGRALATAAARAADRTGSEGEVGSEGEAGSEKEAGS
jgi:CO/xanthine dehydrogenase FAD-binding subunit